MRIPLSALAVAALLAGCGGGDGDGGTDVALDPQESCDDGVGALEVPAVVEAGDELALVVKNVTEDSTLTFGLSGRLEAAAEGGWTAADDAAVARPIPELALVVKPGETSGPSSGATADVIELADDAEPGSYRALKDVTATKRGSDRAHQATLCAGFTVSR